MWYGRRMNARWNAVGVVAGGLCLLAAARSTTTLDQPTRAVRAAVSVAFVERTMLAGEIVTGMYRGPQGARAWRLYVPSRYDRTRPPMLLVLLHGCTQNADDIARGSQMDAVAEERGFLVLYPEQSVDANPRTCWNWFDTAHQRRDAGEPAIIAGMITEVTARYPTDPARLHVAGISAGAAMAVLVTAAYPERIASMSSISGVAWSAAQNVGSALMVMQRGAGDALPSADALIGAMGTHARAVPALVVHGKVDAVLAKRNADETVMQWTGLFEHLRRTQGLPPLEKSVEVVATVNDYTTHRTNWTDERGRAMITALVIDELGHAWSGGSPSGTFTDAKGPDVSRLIASFCEQHPLVKR